MENLKCIGWRCVWTAVRDNWVWYSSRVLKDEAEADRVLKHWNEIHGQYTAARGGVFNFKKQALFAGPPTL